MGSASHLESLRERLAAAEAALDGRSSAGRGLPQACALLGALDPAEFPTAEQRSTCLMLRRFLPRRGRPAPDPDEQLSLHDCAAELLGQLEAWMERETRC